MNAEKEGQGPAKAEQAEVKLKSEEANGVKQDQLDTDLDLSYVPVRQLVQTLQEMKRKGLDKHPGYNVYLRLLKERMSVTAETPAYMNRHSILSQQKPMIESFLQTKVPLTPAEKKRRDDQVNEYQALQTLQVSESHKHVEARYRSEGVYDPGQSIAMHTGHHTSHTLLQMKLDPKMLARERDNQISLSLENRMTELGVEPCGWPDDEIQHQPDEELGNGDTIWHLSKFPRKIGVPEQLETRALRLLHFQQQLREEVMAVLPADVVKHDAVEKFGFRKYRAQFAKESRAVAKAKEDLSKTVVKQRRAKDQEWIGSILQGVLDFREFHKRARRTTKVICASLRKHLDALEMEARRKDDTMERERMRALMEDDEEGYRKLIDEKKNSRLLHLLNQTDQYIKQFTELVKRHKETRKKEDGEADPEKLLEQLVADEDPAAAKKSTSDSSYFLIAHSLGETIYTQPSMMVGGNLKSYQMKGLEWMVSLYNNQLNGILADEMGLGKTVQSISLLCYLMETKKVMGPYLIVVPLSTMSNWANEFTRWAPTIKVLRYKGSKEERKGMQYTVLAAQYNVLLTTYELVIKDKATLSKLNWVYLIVDEGHRIKNKESKLTTTLSQYYKVRNRLLLTGTPLQNNLTELWGLMNFLLPDIFNSCQSFEEWFNAPFANTGERQEVTQEEQILVIRRLHKVLRPFLLRRLKTEVESELPEKVESVIKIGMSALQKALYRSLSTKGIMLAQGDKEIKVTAVRNTLMELRKVCNHPYLCDQVEASLAAKHGQLRVDTDLLWRSSGKLELLDRMFKKMTRLLIILEDYLRVQGIKYFKLDGASKAEDRERMLADFNAPDSPHFVFLLSTHAGGLGLNLQSADTVIIFDSDWNPHQDLQAQDRAHRIGQKNEVRVFRLITVNSVEEKILEAAQRKLQMDAKVIQAGRFDQKTSAEERRRLLEDLVQQEMEKANNEDEDDEDPPHTLQEINEMISRSEEELVLFEQMDDDLNQSAGGAHLRLMRPSEVPEIYAMGENYDPQEEEDLTLTYGRGFRDKSAVSYTEISDRQFFKQMNQNDQPDATLRLPRTPQPETPVVAATADLVMESEDDDRESEEERSGHRRKDKKKKKKREKESKKDKSKDKDKEKDRLAKHLRKLYNSVIKCCSDDGRELYASFLNKPSVKAHRDYYRVVREPISLAEVKEKITGRKYSSMEGLQADVQLMATNASIYYGEDSTEAADGQALVQAFDECLAGIQNKSKKSHHRHHHTTTAHGSLPVPTRSAASSPSSTKGRKRKHKDVDRKDSTVSSTSSRPLPVVLRLKG